MLERLQDQTTSDNQYLQQSLIEYSDDVLDDGEYNETANPIMDKTLEEAGAEGIRVLANFTPEGFEVIREQAEIAMTSRWKEGRGLLEKHAVDFGLKAPTLKKLVVRVMAVCSELHYDSFVVKPTMTSLRTKGKVFARFPYALHATDVKFQPAHRSAGRFGEQKHYFSRKQKLYGFKIEASVSPAGVPCRHESSRAWLCVRLDHVPQPA
ncbi:hypothetical protein H310_12597 [Aphanomyces invadans]|uniref:Uncharacterized protein n=1 Tax=Aphanomyces invadans TaxID=157072 RepID=A0A024TH28_9STRA|nr:hypothetical protein H310_12597 [Aphanomyces invadans]ETV93309.1 hypothetical protein H310_12597 [Aphanomyces invadans]|eukprot:XP_008877945.1 hypothetical protein H310_12597 [Aphanomyces invadans]